MTVILTAPLTRASRLATDEWRFAMRPYYLSAPERVRYFYKLEGLDSEWIGAERRRTVTYNNLGRGNYRFRVRAEAPDGISNEASYEFELLPHYYESSWFRSLCAALAAMVVWMMYQLRMRQVRSHLAAVLQERLKLAREIHDTLAQAFVGISAQLDALETCLPENLRPAHIYLELARRMSQHSLTEARRSVMDLRSAALNNQDLSAALQCGARNWTQGSAVDVEVDVRGDVRTLSEDVEHNLLRIAQEAVTNALKHAHPSKITVRLLGNDHNLTLRVSDNGCGFEPEDAFVGMGGHFGLIGIRERAERIGGELRLESQPGAWNSGRSFGTAVMSSKIRILVAEDHLVARVGVSAIINRQTDMVVVAEATNGKQAVERFRKHVPDVTLLDMRMPLMSGVEAAIAIRGEFPNARLIALTSYGGDEDVRRALAAGVDAYLTKDVLRKELLDTIRTVNAGRRYIPEALAAALEAQSDAPTLSEREIEVLELVASGLANKQIAYVLNIAETTAKNHVKNILHKLGVHDRTHAATAAIQRGIIHL